MIRHIWSVPCSLCITNDQTKNLTLIEVLEQLNIQANSLPEGVEGGIAVTFDVASLWVREPIDQPTQGTGRICILSPTGEVLETMPQYEIDLATQPRARTISRSRGLPVRGLGIYHLVVQLREGKETNWQDVARIPLEIRTLPS